MSGKAVIVAAVTVFFFIFSPFSYSKTDIETEKGLTLEQLRSLPYVSYGEEEAGESKIGTIKYNREKSWKGFNLDEESLIDMEGNLVHSWPGKGRVKILEDGNILATNWENSAIGKYTWGNVKVWEREDILMHHDIALTYDNTILVPTKEVIEYKGRKVEFDVIVELDQNGNTISEWSSWDNFDDLKRFHEPSVLDRGDSQEVERNEARTKMWGGEYDYYHLNSIQVLPDNKLGIKDKRFKKGNWLIHLNNREVTLILDKVSKKVTWSLDVPGGAHMPRMLENGNILIFENGRQRKYSKVVELDPLTKEAVWSYQADPPESFYSHAWGSAQRLPNGNTLISEAASGRAFEITKKGETVWEWFTSRKNKEGKRAITYRVIRYPTEKIEKIIKDKISKK